MRKSDAAFRLKLHKHLLTRQQVRTLYGQIKHGDIEAAMKGLDKLLGLKKVGDV